MTATEYIANFFLVIIGFAVSELLKGSARLIRERKKIIFYWPALIVVPVVFEVLIFWFLHVFTIVVGPGERTWTTPDIAWICLQMVPWAFVSFLIFPSRIPEGFDLKKFYLENGPIVIGITTMLTILVAIDMAQLGNYTGLIVQMITLVINVLVIVYFERLHLIWLFTTIVLVNYFMFFVRPIAIG